MNVNIERLCKLLQTLSCSVVAAPFVLELSHI